jgi:hypothetical protein
VKWVLLASGTRTVVEHLPHSSQGEGFGTRRNKMTLKLEFLNNQKHIFLSLSQFKLQRLTQAHRVWIGWILEFFKLLLFLKMFLGGCLTPSSRIVWFLWYPFGQQSQLRKWFEHSFNGFDKLKNLTNSEITVELDKIMFVPNVWLKIYLVLCLLNKQQNLLWKKNPNI